mmetsp:Transcript_20619/g.37105  ORF Transcript_20619/g.37105 Transcript_20619/m.37105 type:complete len:146 (+) Transcript_20619:91-528(+)
MAEVMYQPAEMQQVIYQDGQPVYAQEPLMYEQPQVIYTDQPQVIYTDQPQYVYEQPQYVYEQPQMVYQSMPLQSAPSMMTYSMGPVAYNGLEVDHSQGRWFQPGEPLPEGFVAVAHPEGLMAPPAVAEEPKKKEKGSKKKKSGCC